MSGIRTSRSSWVAVIAVLTAFAGHSAETSLATPLRTEANSLVIKEVSLNADLVVCGGGLAGVCTAVSAARHGAKVVLIQDRPMLGGNSSSEIRISVKGAIGADNRETGILEEMELENLYRNPSQRYTLWDDVLLSTVLREKNIILLLNASVNDVRMEGSRIASVMAWNSHATTRYAVSGKIFADCTGDGILRLSGAKFRRGRESREEFGESYLPAGDDSGTMGNTLLLQLRQTPGEDRPFRPPEWAYRFTERDFPEPDRGKNVMCNGVRVNVKRSQPSDNSFWWVECGGAVDTIGDANDIQLELKKIGYGAWDYIKNHPDGRGKGWELAWMGSLPGKRESTRFVGPYVLTQDDILRGGKFPDVVAYGGWTFDDHDPRAFWHPDHISVEHEQISPFGIPFGCLYSVNVPNLMFAGRDVSVTHVALSATRVMGTCALLGQAVGTGAALMLRRGLSPAEFHRAHVAELQSALEEDDVMLPGRRRRPSALTLAATLDVACVALTNGIDRCFSGRDNGVWFKTGESCTCVWSHPVRVSGIRLIFDSDLGRPRRRPKVEGVLLPTWKMPRMLAKSYRVEARLDGQWRTMFAEDENFRRLRRISFAPVNADALRLVILSAWGGGEAHVFALDAE